jgi:hypothetical protein
MEQSVKDFRSMAMMAMLKWEGKKSDNLFLEVLLV